MEFFHEDICKQVDEKDIEYIPTQVMTEFFRRKFRDPEGDKIDGIIYTSAKESSHRNYVFFGDPKINTETEHRMLRLVETVSYTKEQVKKITLA